MHSLKGLLRHAPSTVILAAFMLGIVFILSFIFARSAPIKPTAANAIASAVSIYKPQSVVAGLPARLRIPKINVNTTLAYVGLTPQGELGVPTGPSNAAWYDKGPRPGQVGSAVIDGHYGWRDNIPAVFDNLYKLQKGDNLYVQAKNGVTTTFVVSSVQTYGQNQDDSNVFISNDGKAHLNLITCEGTWNAAQQSYSNRLVVFADKVTPQGG